VTPYTENLTCMLVALRGVRDPNSDWCPCWVADGLISPTLAQVFSTDRSGMT